MSLENVNDSGRQNPGYETQKGGSAAYGSGFPKILFSRVSNLGFHEKLSNEEIQTFLLLRHCRSLVKKASKRLVKVAAEEHERTKDRSSSGRPNLFFTALLFFCSGGSARQLKKGSLGGIQVSF